ncbi:MAG TPA: cell wall hydrolase [Caulobacteraceae bacterium]
MSSKVRTPAATRALIATLVAGALLGLATGAVCVAGAHPSADQARVQALAGAAQAGYAAAHAAPAPAPAAVSSPAADVEAARAKRRPRLAARAGDVDCLASAVYYEARGESLAGRAAVAQVVLNRVGAPTFPKSVCGVVFQGRADGDCQFSFVCNGAMDEPREAAAWVDARTVARRALAGYVMTAIGAANCFHGTHGGSLPEGGLRLGGHVFYRT